MFYALSFGIEHLFPEWRKDSADNTIWLGLIMVPLVIYAARHRGPRICVPAWLFLMAVAFASAVPLLQFSPWLLLVPGFVLYVWSETAKKLERARH